MNSVLFAKMDQVFSKENKTLKKYWKFGKKYWKSQGKVREFCQSGKVGTLLLVECVSTAEVPPVYPGIPWYQGYPPCGQTNTCENITFPQLRWR